MALPKWPGTAIKVFGAVLFVVCGALMIWSIFFDKNANRPLTPEEQRRMDDLLNRQTLAADAGSDASDAADN